MGSANPGQVVLSGIRQQADQAMKSKSMSSIAPRSVPQVSVPSSCPGTSLNNEVLPESCELKQTPSSTSCLGPGVLSQQ